MPRLSNLAAGLVLAGLLYAGPAAAQTDYYNLDKNRPTRVEDAYTSKQYAFEVKAVPLALAGMPGGATVYRPEVEIKYGLLPGLDIETGLSVPLTPLSAGLVVGGVELDASVLFNVTVETRLLPALGLRATMHSAPAFAGPLGFELRGLATRTLVQYVRLHVNGALGLGAGREEDWWAGVAVDYTMPFDGLLLVASGYAASVSAAHAPDGGMRWHTDAGARYQLTPTLALDAGLGRTWAGPAGPEWRLALGLTHEFGVRALIPTRR